MKSEGKICLKGIEQGQIKRKTIMNKIIIIKIINSNNNINNDNNNSNKNKPNTNNDKY